MGPTTPGLDDRGWAIGPGPLEAAGAAGFSVYAVRGALTLRSEVVPAALADLAVGTGASSSVPPTTSDAVADRLARVAHHHRAARVFALRGMGNTISDARIGALALLQAQETLVAAREALRVLQGQQDANTGAERLADAAGIAPERARARIAILVTDPVRVFQTAAAELMMEAWRAGGRPPIADFLSTVFGSGP